MPEQVVLVDEKDKPLGLMEKQEAHIKGMLHRAVSVIVLNDKDEMLIQQRAAEKYHSPLLWANACCSHPRENEAYIEAAERRLEEEMGLRSKAEPIFDFIYKADVGQGLIEHELDHVFLVRHNGEAFPNIEEVASYKWISLKELSYRVETHPQDFAVWFQILIPKFLEVYACRYSS